MNARKLYAAAYRALRSDLESPPRIVIDEALELGIIERSDLPQLQHVIDAAAESLSAREACEPYEGWMTAARNKVVYDRLFRPYFEQLGRVMEPIIKTLRAAGIIDDE